MIGTGTSDVAHDALHLRTELVARTADRRADAHAMLARDTAGAGGTLEPSDTGGRAADAPHLAPEAGL